MKNKSTKNITFPNIQNKSVGTFASLRAEDKVKSVYPEAVLKWGWIPQSTWDWSTDGSHYGKEIMAKGVWIGNKCYAYGGKFEHILWRRTWKKIQQEMLKKLAS